MKSEQLSVVTVFFVSAFVVIIGLQGATYSKVSNLSSENPPAGNCADSPKSSTVEEELMCVADCPDPNESGIRTRWPLTVSSLRDPHLGVSGDILRCYAHKMVSTDCLSDCPAQFKADVETVASECTTQTGPQRRAQRKLTGGQAGQPCGINNLLCGSGLTCSTLIAFGTCLRHPRGIGDPCDDVNTPAQCKTGLICPKPNTWTSKCQSTCPYSSSKSASQASPAGHIPVAQLETMCTDDVTPSMEDGTVQGITDTKSPSPQSIYFMVESVEKDGLFPPSRTLPDGSTIWLSFDAVKAQQQSMPRLFNEKKAFKPNDLGFFRLNGKIFSYKPSPVIALAASKEVHAQFRKYLNTMFWNNKKKPWTTQTYKDEATTFLAAKKHGGKLDISMVADWSLQMMHKYGLGVEISETDANTMNTFTTNAIEASTAPTAAAAVIHPMHVRQKHANYIAKYAEIVKGQYAEDPEVTDEVAGAIAYSLIDAALTYAGPKSVPSLITSMLGVIYGGTYGTPFEGKNIGDRITTEDFTDPAKYATYEFVSEVVRFFPAVFGVPFAAAGSTTRQDLMLPTALRDSKAWGSDSHEFKLRDKQLYDDQIAIAWSGFTKDPNFPDEEHTCPGMAMSQAIMLGFMQAFKYTEWKVVDEKGQPTVPSMNLFAPVTWNLSPLPQGLPYAYLVPK